MLRYSFSLISILILQLLHAQVIDAGPDTSICLGTSYTMQGSALPPNALGSWTVIAGCGNFANSSNPLSTITPVCVGESVYSWVVIDTISGIPASDDIIITVYDSSATQSNAGPDTLMLVVPQTSVQLMAVPAVYPQVCQWIIVNGSGTVADSFDPNTSYTGAAIGTSILAWSCNNGPCGTAVDTVSIIVTPNVGIQQITLSEQLHYSSTTSTLLNIGYHTDTQFQLYDASGRLIETFDLPVNTRKNLSSLPVGFYVIMEISSQPHQVLRILK